MTGAEFATYVKRKFLRTDKDTEIYEATTDVISDMNVRFKSEDYKEETYVAGISTVGEYQIALPSDFGHLTGNISIIDTAGDEYYPELQKISKNLYDLKYPDRLLSDTGKMNLSTPREFCIYAGQIYIGPVPDLTTYQYQLNYTTENTAAITSLTDPVRFTSELRHRNILRNGVLFELHDGLGNYEEAAYYKSLYLADLQAIIDMERINSSATSENVAYHGV